MNVTRLTPRDFTSQPWKNGGGRTTELAREGPAEGYLWRVSVAEVERAGPFSAFPGYERTIVLLAGDGMDLTVDGRTVRLDRPLEPFVFDGAAPASCVLRGGPSRDLNVIVDRRRARARVAVVERAVAMTAPTTLLYAPGGDLLRVDGGEGETLAVAAPSLLIEIHRNGP